MIIGELNAAALRQTYLRGINLGAAWSGTGGDAALERLLKMQLEKAEQMMGVLFDRRRVMTLPPSSATFGTDYEIEAAPIDYAPPNEATALYDVLLGYPEVQVIDQVRLFEGYDTNLPPAPVFETIDVASVTLSPMDGHLYIPAGAVTQPQRGQAWAVDYTIGQGRVPFEVVDWVLLGAAIHTLGIAGQGQDLSGGLSSWSLTQDGITEMQVYGGKGQEYGLYTGTIATLHAMRSEINLSRIRLRYQGLRFPTSHF